MTDNKDRFETSIDIDDPDLPTGRDVVQVALTSGGMDSTVCAGVTYETVTKLDYLVYIDTGTGLRENREYVEELADHLGVHMLTARTKESYEDKVREHGFPGPSRHGIMYRSLKERCIQKLAYMTGNKTLNCWTGVRSDESDRRFRNVDPLQWQSRERWHWTAPIHDWSKDDCRAYIDDRGLPENDLWTSLGRSGDCFCGCYGSPEELLDLRAAGCEYHAEWLEDLEDEVADVFSDERSIWAWGALKRSGELDEWYEIPEDERDIGLLCSSCEHRPGYESYTED